MMDITPGASAGDDDMLPAVEADRAGVSVRPHICVATDVHRLRLSEVTVNPDRAS